MQTVTILNEQGIKVAYDSGTPGTNEKPTTYINEDTVGDLLLALALRMDTPACTVEECPECQIERRAWWDASNSLSIPKRREVQKLLRECSVPLPLAPYDQEDM